MSLIFDTHAHYDDEAFNKDREELLSGLLKKGVGNVVDAGASLRSLPRILRLTRKYDFMYGAAGLHPCETYGCGDNLGRPVMHMTDLDGQSLLMSENNCAYSDNKVTDLLRNYDPDAIITSGWTASYMEQSLVEAMLGCEKIVAVGEIGLDYHYDDTRKDIQRDWFARQIAIARKYKKPVIVHSRDAAADTLDMIRSEQAQETGGIIHCFSYSREIAGQYIDMGFMIGIGGVATYKNAVKIKEVVSYMPMENMVLETDCPYLAPTPFRGKRNDSSLIKYVVQVVAALKGLSEEDVISITEENARRVYGIK